MPQSNYTIGTLADAAQVSVETIRFYQRKSLLSIPEKPYGGIRHYSAKDLDRLQFIRITKWLGFTLNEISELLALESGYHCNEVSRLAEDKLIEVRKKLKKLNQIEDALSDLVSTCQSTDGNVSCPLIEALQQQSKNIENID
ncbi:Hg(II)-responsive transcriptional regulator [Haliea sp. AH-315-K21]|uniref:Mercuric resistance operon regulatory protein n=1 Tax=SAR86 cluster bacterium TaxID=2030880 RepID=A0A2A5C8H5_9GAMM|nr:Hg(II)-responsive transcriptional regulator [Haliea sp. AH-315-K21]PCJ40169.1 MAG: Hg(II)-responsive transcriptional regulator [SAR86 cluster bacterium]